MTHVETLKIFPYLYKSNTIADDDVAVYNWCEAQFGMFQPENIKAPPTRWCTGFRGYYFKHEKDYMLTLLRWS